MTERGEPNGGSGPAAESYGTERPTTRAEAAAALRGLADGVDAGAVSIEDGGESITVPVPPEFDFEVEYERDGDEIEFEVELEWSSDAETGAGGPPEETGAGDGRPEETGATDETHPAVETATVTTGPDGDASATGAEDEAESVDPSAAATASDPTAGDERDAVVGRQAAVEAAAPLASLGRFEVFRDRADQWRWRLVHRNGNVIASSGQGYTRKHNAEKGLRSVMRNAPGADVVEDGE